MTIQKDRKRYGLDTYHVRIPASFTNENASPPRFPVQDGEKTRVELTGKEREIIRIFRDQDYHCRWDDIQDQLDVRDLLHADWQARGMDYGKKYATRYLLMGHSFEIQKEHRFEEQINGELAGYIAVVIWDGDLAELRDFVVNEAVVADEDEIRDQLLDRALQWCQKQNVRKVHDKTFFDLWPFYKQRGFHTEGVLEDHFIDGEDLLVVSKSL